MSRCLTSIAVPRHAHARALFHVCPKAHWPALFGGGLHVPALFRAQFCSAGGVPGSQPTEGWLMFRAFRERVKKGEEVDDEECASVVQACVRERNYGLAERALKHSKNIIDTHMDSATGKALIQMYVNTKQYTKAKEVFARFREANWIIDADVCTLMFKVYFHCIDHTSAFVFFDELRRKNFVFSKESLNQLVALCVRVEYLDGAQTIVDYVVAENYRLSEVASRELLCLLTANNFHKTVFKLFGHLMEFECELSVESYVQCILSCERNNDAVCAVIVFNAILQHELEIDAPSSESLLRLFCECGDDEIALSLCDYAERLHLYWSDEAFTWAVLLFCRKKKLEKAQALLRRFADVLMSHDAVFAVLELAEEEGKIGDFHDLTHRFCIHGDLDTEQFNRVLAVFVRACVANRAEQIYRVMMRSHVPADGRTYSLLIEVYSKSNQIHTVQSLYQELCLANLPIEPAVYKHLADMYRRAGLFELEQRIIADETAALEAQQQQGIALENTQRDELPERNENTQRARERMK